MIVHVLFYGISSSDFHIHPRAQGPITQILFIIFGSQTQSLYLEEECCESVYRPFHTCANLIRESFTKRNSLWFVSDKPMKRISIKTGIRSGYKPFGDLSDLVAKHIYWIKRIGYKTDFSGIRINVPFLYNFHDAYTTFLQYSCEKDDADGVDK